MSGGWGFGVLKLERGEEGRSRVRRRMVGCQSEKSDIRTAAAHRFTSTKHVRLLLSRLPVLGPVDWSVNGALCNEF